MAPQYVDPASFNPIDLFNIVLVDNSQDFISWGIKDDTASNYNHAMTQRSVAMVDSQDMFYHSVPLKKYLIPANKLKFWQIKDLTEDEWQLLNKVVLADLNAPLWQRFYNYLGIVGQAVKLPWISFPGLRFCSQRVAIQMRNIPRIAAVLPENVSPGFEDAFFTSHPELFTCAGYWWSD